MVGTLRRSGATGQVAAWRTTRCSAHGGRGRARRRRRQCRCGHRVGTTVFRPSNPHTPAIHALLRHVREQGFDGVPQPLGIDPDGRERLEYIDGDVPYPPFPHWSQSDRALATTAALLRQFHDAQRGFVAPAGTTWSDELADPQGGPVICHNDVCPENVVHRAAARSRCSTSTSPLPGVVSTTWRSSRRCAFRSTPPRTRRVSDAAASIRSLGFASSPTTTGCQPIVASSSTSSAMRSKSADRFVSRRVARVNRPSSRCGTTWADRRATTVAPSGSDVNRQRFLDALS